MDQICPDLIGRIVLGLVVLSFFFYGEEACYGASESSDSDMDVFHAPSDQTEPSWEMPDLRNGSDSAEDGPLIGDEYGPGCGPDEQ